MLTLTSYIETTEVIVVWGRGSWGTGGASLTSLLCAQQRTEGEDVNTDAASVTEGPKNRELMCGQSIKRVTMLWLFTPLQQS